MKQINILKVKQIFVILHFMLFSAGNYNSFGQSNTYPYTDTSVITLLKNSDWLRSSAQKLLSAEQQALTPDDKVDIAIILDDNEGGLKLIEEIIEKNLSKYPVTWVALCRSYFKSELKNTKETFPEELKNSCQKLNISMENRDGLASIDTPLKDSMLLEQMFNQYLKIKLRKPEKVLTDDEVKRIMTFAGGQKILTSYGPELRQFAAEVNKEFEKATKYWESIQYHFTESDKPQMVITANMQCFDKDQFPENQIWKNPKEIPDNKIDDDNNGIIDDVYGIIFNPKDNNKPAPIFLDRKMDRQYFQNAGEVYHPHGTMTAELMLKENPTVKIMGIEHSQYDPVWKEIQSRFTKDIAQNRWLIDSIIIARLRVWQHAIQYIKTHNVQVVEINSMGFLLNGDEFVLTGCGKDEADTKRFTEKKFRQLVDGFTKCFVEAPNTLFVLSAGNDSVNTKNNPNLNNQIHLPNTLIVGALYKDLLKTRYSNYGPDVDVYAPAHFELKSKNTYPQSSGTSAASPVVCNTAIKLFSLNPELTPEQVKRFIISASDKDLYEKGINIINPLRAVELMKKETM